MVNWFRISIGVAFIAGLSACGTMNEFFDTEVYEAPPAELVDFTPEFNPVVAWSTDTGGSDSPYSDLAPWLQGDMIVAVDDEGEVNSYVAQTGRKLWNTDLDVPVASGVGGGEGLILVGTQEGEVFALDETNGELLWKKQLSSEVLSPPTAAMGIVVARTSDGRVNGLSAEDGSGVWSYQRAVPLLSLRGASAPILIDDMVIAGFANGKLVALSIIDGKVIWDKSVAIPGGRTEIDRLVDVDSEPVIIDGKIYVVAYHGEIAVMDLASGEKIWSREMSSRSGLDVDPLDAVYVSDDQSYVWALQAGTGDSLWRQTSLLRRKITAPVIVGENIIVGDFEGYIHWMSREDGHFVAREDITGDPIRSKPVVQGNLVFVAATDGTLTAFKIQ